MANIETNGLITYRSGGVTQFYLDGIRFRVDDMA
jgi:hypothetical protein